ncbi:MAG: MBL fold metallo-hydrolase [Phycisphaerales bacterium]|nr:MBL fold metallo-hydrolase [Phycisphaerales bacterium]
MFFRMVYDDKLAQAAYLIGCQRTGEAVVIDPERDVDRYVDLARREGLRITHAAETHIHADFLSGVRELAERGATACVSGEGGEEWSPRWLGAKSGGGAYASRVLRDGDTFAVGHVELRAVHTPGHTPEHLSYAVTDRGSGAGEPMGIVTGDFVFVGDLGRPDLLETAAGQAGAAAPAARRLHRSAVRFAGLPDFLQVWPAHGSGSACGKALGAVPQSTVGYERRNNPGLRAAASGEREFMDYILAGQPEPPLYFARMKRMNRDGVPPLGELPRPRRVAADQVASPGSVQVVDTRTWKEFAGGHLPGSFYLPLNQSFTTDAGSMLDPDLPVVLVLEERRVEEAVRDLCRIGIDRAEGFVEPADVARLAAGGGAVARAEDVSVERARGVLKEGTAFFLDVRRAGEFAEGHIPGARNTSHTRLAAHLGALPRDRTIVVNCKAGGRSARAVALLRRAGYDAVNLAGGFDAWSGAGAPVSP